MARSRGLGDVYKRQLQTGQILMMVSKSLEKMLLYLV
jgi:hypothetical protein